MHMTLPQLARVAKNFLKVVREKALTSLDALAKVVEEPLDPASGDDHDGEEYVIVRQRGGSKFSIDYFRRNGQTPLMFIVDPSYVKCMVTADRAIDGYTVFDETDDGKMQDRRLGEGDFGLIVKELEALIALGAGAPAANPEVDAVDEAVQRARTAPTPASAVEILSPVLPAARALGDERRLSSLLLLLGQAERFARKFDDAAGRFTEALPLCEKHGDLIGVETALGNLLGMAREQGRFGEARAFGARLVKNCHDRADLRGVGRTLFNIAYTFLLEGNGAEAVTGLNHAAKVLKQVKDEDGLKAVADALAKAKSLPTAKSARKKPAKRPAKKARKPAGKKPRRKK
jgi:tetratricopeptide (TPR) repeat protein